MSQAINRYKTDLRELNFVLFEQFKLAELLSKEPFANWDEDSVKMVINEVARFGREVMTGVYDSDMGLWTPDSASALGADPEPMAYRRRSRSGLSPHIFRRRNET